MKWGLKGQGHPGYASLPSNQNPSNPHHASRPPAQRSKGSLLLQQGQTLPREKCFPNTLCGRKNGSLSARISQPGLLTADVQEPLVVPSMVQGCWHSQPCQRGMPPARVAALGSQLRSQRSQGLHFPFPVMKGTVPEALALSNTPYGLASQNGRSPTDESSAIMSLPDTVLLSSFDSFDFQNTKV